MKLDASSQNVGLLLIVGALGGALVFHAVPQENRETISMIVGGCLALLRGAPSSSQGGSVGQ